MVLMPAWSELSLVEFQRKWQEKPRRKVKGREGEGNGVSTAAVGLRWHLCVCLLFVEGNRSLLPLFQWEH